MNIVLGIRPLMFFEGGREFLHVYGNCGTGKTYIIKRFFSAFPIFDIEDIYKKYGYAKRDLNLIYNKIMNFIRNHSSGVVETSGRNKIVNTVLKRVKCYNLYIKRPIQQLVLTKSEEYINTLPLDLVPDIVYTSSFNILNSEFKKSVFYDYIKKWV